MTKLMLNMKMPPFINFVQSGARAWDFRVGLLKTRPKNGLRLLDMGGPKRGDYKTENCFIQREKMVCYRGPYTTGEKPSSSGDF